MLDRIEDDFESIHKIDLRFVPVGTGLAIKYAKGGNADLILVHDRERELEFMEDGYGNRREEIAYNFFLIVGPEDDPAGIRGMGVEEALKRLVDSGRNGKIVWVSRGDNSGTHAREIKLWRDTGFEPSQLRDEKWYIESGTGMGKTLLIAWEKMGYTLSDMGTFLKYSRAINLDELIREDRKLLNIYSVIAVSRKANPEVNVEDAMIFIEYLLSDGQKIIREYGMEEYGRPLFYGMK